jgi:hypothetical protein
VRLKNKLCRGKRSAKTMLLAQRRVREVCRERGDQKGRTGVATGYAGGRGGGKKKRWEVEL